MPRRATLFALLWLAALAAGAAFDRPVAEYVHQRGWDNKSAWSKRTHRVTEALKFPGTFATTAIAAAALLAAYFVVKRPSPWAAALVAAAGGVSGTNSLIKWVVGRHRPVIGIAPFEFHPFAGGIPGLFGAEKDLSFPSGHTCLAFATAAALAIVLPRWRWVFYTIAVIVGLERIGENAHYLSDTLAGAAFGILCAVLVKWVIERVKGKRRAAVIGALHKP